VAQRALKWSLPILILVEIVLVRTGWLSIGQAIAIVVLVEGALTLVAGVQAIRVVRRYRHQRAAGRGGVEAFEDALTVLMPHRLARLVALELRLWLCLGRWLFRRYQPDEREFSYRKRSIVAALVVLVILTAPVEILILELLIPWAWLRWVLLALAIYGMIWVIGLYASLVVLPYRVADDGLWIRYGLLSEAFIPFPEVVDIQVASRKVPTGRDGLRVVEEERAAYLVVGGRTDVTLTLRRPQLFRTALG
jgi:membrane protein YdbS with pleckstrin-like domain